MTMDSNRSLSFEVVSLDSERRGPYNLERRESEDCTDASLPFKHPQHGNASYSLLSNAEQLRQSGTTKIESQQSQEHPESTTSDTISTHSTIKNYNHRESRKFLLWTGFNRFCVTLFLCLFIGLTLRAYEGLNKPHTRALSKSDVRIFNAIILGLSLALGLNLASSLKHYGLLLRWSILTRRYVSLQAFDLILGCENLTNVFKLMVISFPGVHKIPSIRFPPWRQKTRWRGAKFTWLICLAWLLLNVGAQTLVATLSIFWPTDTLDAMPLTGNVSISNIMAWQADSFPLQLSSANLYGLSGSLYPVFAKGNPNEISSQKDDISIVRGDGYYEYSFLDKDLNNVASSRTVQARAACIQFSFGEDEGKRINGMVEASLDGGKTWSVYNVIRAVGGQIAWTGILSHSCGPRCTSLLVYQRADHKNVEKNAMFLCNSTISEVRHIKNAFGNLREEDKPHVDSTDDFARIAAGAIAWTGDFDSGNRDNQTRTYPTEVPFSPNHTVSPMDVEDIISRFSIGAIAAFDDHGPRYIVSNPPIGPVRDQQLRVDWVRIIIILSWICLVQFAALLAMLAFANKSIIRDESFFSVAMLLSPVVSRITREEGINLSGEEILAHPNLVGKRIRYDYVKVRTATKKLKKVDILFQETDDDGDNYKRRKMWADGEYI
ncbi:hypothetical protein CC78DRAFT_621407 [Lojkania enalia]|uniref:Uncharacterized protein n=1 Tax=Lojkania enalia TaxID=147567 RepID=A0A9P4K0A8_9PLEO|nr:hypothetical protein CC78DRAFT_621407 [Didymosphaeria enalia]